MTTCVIELTKGRLTLVSPEDYEYLGQWKWHCGSAGYAQGGRKVGGKSKTVLMHRIIAQRMGLSLDGLNVDHINRDRLDNRRENIRVVTRRQNSQNTSGFKGGCSYDVSSTNRPYQASIRFNGVLYTLGRYTTEEGARKAYQKACAEINSGTFVPPSIRQVKGYYRLPGNPAKPYYAQIMINRKTIFLGTFATAEEAANAYQEARKGFRKNLPS